jgi:hypothetical protein
MKNIESRITALERLRKNAPPQPVEVHIIGVTRAADGTLIEDSEPGIIVRIPATKEDGKDRTEN